MSYTSSLGLTKPSAGTLVDSWGPVANTNFDTIDAAISGTLSRSVAGSSNVTLDASAGTTNEASYAAYTFTGALTGNIVVFFPAKQRSAKVKNSTSGAYTLTVAVTGTPGSTVAIPQGSEYYLWIDGTNVMRVLGTEASNGTVQYAVTNTAKLGVPQFQVSSTYSYTDATVGWVTSLIGATLTIPQNGGVNPSIANSIWPIKSVVDSYSVDSKIVGINTTVRKHLDTKRHDWGANFNCTDDSNQMTSKQGAVTGLEIDLKMGNWDDDVSEDGRRRGLAINFNTFGAATFVEAGTAIIIGGPPFESMLKRMIDFGSNIQVDVGIDFKGAIARVAPGPDVNYDAKVASLTVTSVAGSNSIVLSSIPSGMVVGSWIWIPAAGDPAGPMSGILFDYITNIVGTTVTINGTAGANLSGTTTVSYTYGAAPMTAMRLLSNQEIDLSGDGTGTLKRTSNSLVYGSRWANPKLILNDATNVATFNYSAGLVNSGGGLYSYDGSTRNVGYMIGGVAGASVKFGADASSVDSNVNVEVNPKGTGQVKLSNGQIRDVRVQTGAGSVTVVNSDRYVVVNKTVGAATSVNLMASPTTGTVLTVIDGKGDANVNNITITPAAGTINGAATYVINTARGRATIVYSGSEWLVVGT